MSAPLRSRQQPELPATLRLVVLVALAVGLSLASVAGL